MHNLIIIACLGVLNKHIRSCHVEKKLRGENRKKKRLTKENEVEGMQIQVVHLKTLLYGTVLYCKNCMVVNVCNRWSMIKGGGA